MVVMGNQQACWVLLAVAALSFVACDVALVSDPSATVIPAFLWSDSRCAECSFVVLYLPLADFELDYAKF